MCPSYTLHHLVRERYPRFVDALSDLDDALTLTYLFAALPSTVAIKAKMGAKAKTLAAAWGAYCSTAGCITKSFISVKGVYLEATIRGVPIRWVVPHSFTQFMPEDVDYKVMSTFFEFYETLLNFVLFKLYSDLGVRFPLTDAEGTGEVKGSTTYILGSNLRSLNNAMNSADGAITNVISETLEDEETNKARNRTSEEKKKDRELIKTVGAALDNVQEDNDEIDGDDEENAVDIAGPLKVALESMEEDKVRSSIPAGEEDLDDDAIKRRRLFAGFTFFLSREVPRGYLELICLAFGAKVGWEGPNSPIGAKDPSITHHIIDRPKLLSSYDSLPKSREYVQPQWILDCTNFMYVLPIEKYGVGKALPPHLSPWVDNDEEGYKPAYAEEIEKLKRGEVIEEGEKVDDDSVSVDAGEKSEEEVADEEDSESESESEEEGNIKRKKEDLKKKKARAKKRREEEEKEAHELAKSMMSRKAAHLYGRMQHGISKKQARIDDLESRRRDPLQNKEKDEDGKSMLKQKVERLKRERKEIEDLYSNTGGTMKKSKKKKRKST